ncbi:MAG TPA: nucleotide exchange factor GrpE, partial [Nostocaceae cyanobacterium]|nr:nucleotide exchange factor GrpE [Nostocaceae cyanobacterium]
GVSSFKSLCRAADISEWQIWQLRRGKVEQMRLSVLLKISKALNISLSELIAAFSPAEIQAQNPHPKLETPQNTDLQQEYARLLQVLEQQQEVLQQEFQQSSLQILESLLLFLPTAAQKARENPQEPAVKILTLVQKPLEKLLQSWGVVAIASVGAELAYDPQFHELVKGSAQPGETVKVSHVGYMHNGKLLYRAKVICLSV